MKQDILEHLSFRKMFPTKEEQQRVLKLAAKESLAGGKRAVLTIMIFEIILLIMWFAVGSSFRAIDQAVYFWGYLFLFLCSIVCFVLILILQRDISKNHRTIIGLNFTYDLILIVWSVYFTAIDTYFNGYFYGLVFITIIVIIPAISFLHPMQYFVFHICGCTAVSFIILFLSTEGKRGNMINFIVFALISLLSGLTFYGVRFRSYKRQLMLEDASEHDSLSGLYNRQKLGKISGSIWNRCLEKKLPLTCILCDIDDFKKINDVYGHLVGDAWIVEVSKVMKHVLSGTSEYCFRYGGEEFLILLENVTKEKTCRLVEQMQEELANIEDKPGNVNVTLSYGIYSGYPENGNIEQYYSKADKLMYQAKKNGKDNFCSE